MQARKGKKEITDKIFMAVTQKRTNTHLPTQQGWTAEGKVIPISNRHLSCATVSHTHFTLACHIHKSTDIKTHTSYKYKHIQQGTHAHTETSTYKLCKACAHPFLSPPLFIVFSPLSVSLLFTSHPFVSCLNT